MHLRRTEINGCSISTRRFESSFLTRPDDMNAYFKRQLRICKGVSKNYSPTRGLLRGNVSSYSTKDRHSLLAQVHAAEAAHSSSLFTIPKLETRSNFSFFFASPISFLFCSSVRFFEIHRVCPFSFPFVEVFSVNLRGDHLAYSRLLTMSRSIEDTLMCDNHSFNQQTNVK